MTKLLTVVSVVASVMALAPLVSQAKPPKAPGNLTLTAAPNPVKFGRSVTLSGKLTGANNAGREVNVFADSYPYDGFAKVGSATTNATGDYSFVQQPTVNTRYQARQANEQSSVVTVLVRPAVSLRLSDSTPRRGQRVRFSGKVCPQHDGSSLSIQRRFSGRYRTVRRTTLKDVPGSTCSKYSKAIRVRRDGRFRAVIGADLDHATGISRSRRVDVHA